MTDYRDTQRHTNGSATRSRRRLPRPMLDVWVPGRPIPQGSMTPIRKGPRLGVRSANDTTLKPWRAVVALAVADRECTALGGPLRVDIDFVFRRPKNHYRTGANAHLFNPANATAAPIGRGQGDVDKLSRAILDALTDAHAITDDAIVVDLRARKLWSPTRDGAEGCDIRIFHAHTATLEAAS